MPDHTCRPVTVSATIPADPETVLAYISDTTNDPEWCPNVESAEMTSAGPIRPGSTFRYHQHLDRPGSARVEFDGEVTITALNENTIEWQVDDKFQERSIACAVEAVPDGTRITQTTVARFHRQPGLARHLYPFLARRTLKKQLEQLAAHFANSDR